MRRTFGLPAVLMVLAACTTTQEGGETPEAAIDPASVETEIVWQAAERAITGAGDFQLMRTDAAALTSLATGRLSISHCLDGACPVGATLGNSLVVRELYALSNNPMTKLADWVAYHPTRETFATTVSLERDWKADPLLDPSVTLEPRTSRETDDYRGANAALGVERGHLAPLTLFADTEFWRSTNFYSNIAPQSSALNQGPWRHLEDAEKQSSFDLRELFVITGPLYEIEMQCDPSGRDPGCLPNADEDHRVPSHFWKVISNRSGSKISAFIMPQEATRSDPYCGYRRDLSEVEARSGLTLFPSLSSVPSGTLDVELGCGADS